MSFNIIVSDSEYSKYLPGAYTNQVEEFIPLLFHPRADTCIVDKRRTDGTIDLIYQARSIVTRIEEIQKIIDTKMKDTNLGIIDYKKMRLVLDMENDVPYVWNMMPPKGENECLVFSGDGRKLAFSCYYQAKLSVWILNIISQFDMTTLTVQGQELAVRWAEAQVGEEIPWAIRQSINKYCMENTGTSQTETDFDGYNYAKVMKMASKISLPSANPYQIMLKPPEASDDDRDIPIVAGSVPISFLIGMSDFDKLIGLDIEFDLPMPLDIISAMVDNTGEIVFEKRVGGNTDLQVISEDFQIPLDKLFFQYKSSEQNKEGV